MAKATPSGDGPRRRAVDNLIERFRRGAHAQSQPLLLLDPPGYGASRVLDDVVERLRADPSPIAGFKLGSIAERPDGIDNLAGLLVEFAAAASADPGDLPNWRRRMQEWQLSRDPAGFREDMDHYLDDIFARVPGVILFVPRMDKILAQLSGLSPREDWQMRGYISNYPIRIVATAPERLRTTADDAFFQSFWNIAPELYGESDLTLLGQHLRLSKQATERLRDLSLQMGGRADLVERAAGLLAVTPSLTTERLMRELARNPPSAMLEQLELASRQALKILSSLASFAEPAEAGMIGRAANVSGNVVSTQMGRLADQGLVQVIRSNGRDRRYAFADEVAGRLYAVMVDALEQQWNLAATQAS